MNSMQGSENRGAASCDVAASDCMTMKLHEQLNNIAESGGKLYTSQRRYFYFLPEMERKQRLLLSSDGLS